MDDRSCTDERKRAEQDRGGNSQSQEVPTPMLPRSSTSSFGPATRAVPAPDARAAAAAPAGGGRYRARAGPRRRARRRFQDLFFDRPRCLADALAAARAPGGLRAWARRLAAETRGGDSAAAAACARAADDAAALAASLGGGGGGDDCQGFAGALYGAFFADAAAALLEAHPPGALDGDGRPFWAGTRLPPTPAAALFDATDESDPAPAFLDATAALRRTSLGLAAPARAAAAATAAAAAARGFRGRAAAAPAPARLSDAVARLEASLARLAAAGGRAGVGLDALRGRVLCGNQPLVWGVPTKLQNSLSRSNRSRFG